MGSLTRASKRPRKMEGWRDERLERLELPSKSILRCHNQANQGPRKVGKALKRLDLTSKLVKRCHNRG